MNFCGILVSLFTERDLLQISLCKFRLFPCSLNAIFFKLACVNSTVENKEKFVGDMVIGQDYKLEQK